MINASCLKKKLNLPKVDFKELLSSSNLLFIPGIFLFAAGIVVLVAPGLLLGFLAVFFLLTGILLTVLAWKMLRLKKKVEEIISSLGGRIVIHGVNLNDPLDADELEEEKIIMH
jgi:hypothetical protein